MRWALSALLWGASASLLQIDLLIDVVLVNLPALDPNALLKSLGAPNGAAEDELTATLAAGLRGDHHISIAKGLCAL